MGKFRGGKAHKLTKEDRSKGGKRVTEKKRIANSLRRRKYCNEKCMFWKFCPFKYQSFSVNKGECFLKTLPLQMQHQLTKMLTEEGMRDILKEIYSVEYVKKITDNIHRERLLKHGIELYKTLYGNRQSINVDMKTDITAEKIREIYLEVTKEKDKNEKNTN